MPTQPLSAKHSTCASLTGWADWALSHSSAPTAPSSTSNTSSATGGSTSTARRLRASTPATRRWQLSASRPRWRRRRPTTATRTCNRATTSNHRPAGPQGPSRPATEDSKLETEGDPINPTYPKFLSPSTSFSFSACSPSPSSILNPQS